MCKVTLFLRMIGGWYGKTISPWLEDHGDKMESRLLTAAKSKKFPLASVIG